MAAQKTGFKGCHKPENPPTIQPLTTKDLVFIMRDKEIHNTGNMWRHRFPRHHLLAACGISLAITLLLTIVPDSVIANRPASLTPDTILPDTASTALPPPAEVIAAAPPVVDPWLHMTVRQGDTLSSLLQKAGLSLTDVHELINSSKDAKALTDLSLDDELDLLIKDGKIQELRLHHNELSSVTAVREGDQFQTRQVTRTPEIRQGFANGVIDSSLFIAAQKAGLNDRMTLKLADIFAYDIDFLQDLQDGDSFSVLYEELYLDGKKVGNGKILAAEFINQGKSYRAVQYTNQDGSSNYYTPDGTIMRKQFLRTPVDFAKVTSYFSLSRKHPILHKIRAHKGIDYGAPRGTPIRAAGDGKVIFAGVRSGFGNVVMVQHGGAYTTLYGHMDKIAVKNGARIEQGQTLGTVGSTGLATGPHLHYEFHVNGVAVNPLANTNMAMAEPLSKAEKSRFNGQAAPLFAQLTQKLAATKASSTLALAGDSANNSHAGNNTNVH